MRPWFPLVVAIAGCTTTSSSSQFELLLADTPIEIEAPVQLLVQIVVVGADGQAVTLTSPNLPAFAVLNDTTINLDPGYADAGDYAVALVASTSTGDTATGTMHLHVTRANTGPMWLPEPFLVNGYGNEDPYAAVRAPVCDKENDNFTFEVNVAPVGGVFSGQADFSIFVDFSVTPPLPYEPGMSCADLTLPLAGLAPGMYQAQIHAFDVLGAEDPYGWVMLDGQVDVTAGP